MPPEIRIQMCRVKLIGKTSQSVCTKALSHIFFDVYVWHLAPEVKETICENITDVKRTITP